MGLVERIEGWERRLERAVDLARDRPYVEGEHNCGRFVCEAIEALTGVDRWPEFSAHATRREALALLARHGSTFEEAIDRLLGFERCSATLARRGDLVCVRTDDGEAHLGVCLGADVALMGARGLLFESLAHATCAWSVG